MFDDKRSKKILLVAHCLLNQNAKLDRCAHYPGVIREAAAEIVKSGVGVLQMPCPELLCLGLDREAEIKKRPSVNAEDTRIAVRMKEPRNQAVCRRIVKDLVYQIEEYRKNGFEILGVVGINGSPTCAVERTWGEDREQEGPGVFIGLLGEELRRKSISLPMKGIRAAEPKKAVAAVRELLRKYLSAHKLFKRYGRFGEANNIEV
jgi:predicted secreted protein